MYSKKMPDFKWNEVLDLLEFEAKMMEDGYEGTYRTDDFQYGDWKDKLPDAWGKDDDALRKYFDIMNEAEKLYCALGEFHRDVSSENIPEYEIYIMLPSGKKIGMYWMTGQGDDFGVFLLDKKKADELGPYIIPWYCIDALVDRSSYKKANWYYNQVLDGAVRLRVKEICDAEGEDMGSTISLQDTVRNSAMFVLGQMSIKQGFPSTLNLDNIEDFVKECIYG